MEMRAMCSRTPSRAFISASTDSPSTASCSRRRALACEQIDDLVPLIEETEAQVEASGVPIASFVAPGSGHTVMRSDLVYELEVEGVGLIDWITELVEGGVPADVHCTECNME